MHTASELRFGYDVAVYQFALYISVHVTGYFIQSLLSDARVLVFVVPAAFVAFGFQTLCGYSFLRRITAQNIQQVSEATAVRGRVHREGYCSLSCLWHLIIKANWNAAKAHRAV